LVERPSANGKELVAACCKAARVRRALALDGGGMDGSFVGE
jgi:hypothetical protein